MGLRQGAGGDHLTEHSFDSAFDAYEAVRHRLPGAQTAQPHPRRIETLAEIVDDFDAFFLDAFGVLNIGETAIPGVAERIADIRAAGKQVLVVSNAAGFPQAALIDKYHRLGFDFATEQVVTSRAALLAGLDGRRDLHWGLMATRSTGLRDLEDLTLTYLEEDPAAYDAVEGFLMVGSAAWTGERQTLMEAALKGRPRPVLVGNPDIVAPRETGFSIEPGHFAHRLADRTGVQPQFFGKPFHNIYDLAFARLDPLPPRSRILMVGDSLHTDILGAQTAGIASALVADYGFFQGRDVEQAIRTAGIAPDYVTNRP
ncbi:HAD-IIA family hydrolase [Tropicibacter oceani]|uniref:HAD hydrolase-like protein n=1 Tax=Tropicibacter oceani TaxID=3058420 RepID=A0ABY8QEY7_9RHOB|nr:HAD hydrolase-like protein [Tropicibacter oceani]WGW02352.1 HAD hydrolase-like protein [Tropicibacter oceani]